MLLMKKWFSMFQKSYKASKLKDIKAFWFWKMTLWLLIIFSSKKLLFILIAYSLIVKNNNNQIKNMKKNISNHPYHVNGYSHSSTQTTFVTTNCHWQWCQHHLMTTSKAQILNLLTTKFHHHPPLLQTPSLNFSSRHMFS